MNNKITNKLFQIFITLAISAYLIRLYITGANAYYINPGYFKFNLIMAVILLIIVIATFRWKLGKIRILSSLPIIFLFLMTLLPPQALQASGASNRDGGGTTGGSDEANVSPLLSRDTTTLRVIDWVKLKNYQTDLDSIKGQLVDVIGFVYYSPDNSDIYAKDNLLIGRYVITCCAVDANTYGLEVAKISADGTDLSKKVSSNDWVRIKGSWEIVTRDNTKFAIIKATEVTKVDKPQFPYEQ